MTMAAIVAPSELVDGALAAPLLASPRSEATMVFPAETMHSFRKMSPGHFWQCQPMIEALQILKNPKCLPLELACPLNVLA